MSISNKELTSLAIVAIGAIVVAVLVYLSPVPVKSAVDSSKCDVETVTMKTIGHQQSSTLLAAAGNRAWARIELVKDASGVATSTPSLSFDEGAAATLAAGLQISTGTPSIEFGRNTFFPYIGAVTGITGNGSTTVRVTECLY